MLYVWICYYHSSSSRTLLMAILVTIWGLRLTWNFNRRGGYPPFPYFWKGDEDYRWPAIRSGEIPYFPFTLLSTNKVVFSIFNLTFISFYQNFLLLLITAPSIAAANAISNYNATSPARDDLNKLDAIAAFFFLAAVIIESLADNEQFAFQSEKYHAQRVDKSLLKGDYAAGFNRSGLYSIVRKPNYAAEQAIWCIFYLFSVAATGEYFAITSGLGAILLLMLFQGSGWLTELLTVKKYPAYKEYQKEVPLYLPDVDVLLSLLGVTQGQIKKEE
jgi:steroid 5-alpha reductase family enzyme